MAGKKHLGTFIIYAIIGFLTIYTGRLFYYSSMDSNSAMLLLRASSNKVKVPAVEDAESAYTLINTLDQEDTWLSGKFDSTKRYVISDDTYLCLNSFLPMKSNHYRVMVTSKAYRMIVNKFNNKKKYSGSVDLCNGDIVTLDDSVKYITISIYQYKNRQITQNSNQEIRKAFENGLKFTITKIEDLDKHDTDQELLTSEVHIESLSNFSNYRFGWFKSWGGAYEYREEGLCTRNYYKIDDKAYVYNVNDSRISLSITEYDETGKWVNYIGGLKNGDSFKKQPKTAYIGLTIRSLKWGVDLSELFEYGLRIDLASKRYIDKTGSIDFKDADFSDMDHWKAGSYLYETGEFIIDKTKICFDHFCGIDHKQYVVNLPGGYLKMSILELNKDGKVIVSNDFQSGQRWKKAEDTAKIAITVYGYDKTFTVAEYKKAISGDSDFGLTQYIKYAHDTKMKDVTAEDFINKVNVGWNLGNSFDSKAKERSQTANLKQEIYWGNPYVTKDLIDYVAKSGFNTIRIPVTWYYNTYLDENGKLTISKEWLDRVQDVVDYAIANQMYVILNTHHEQSMIYAGTDEAKMDQVLNDAKAIWTQIAEHFKTYDEHLVFESYNEIDNIEKFWNYSDKAAAQMNELNQVFVDAVRSTGNNNAKRILIIPTLLDGADSRFYSAFQMPKDTVADKIVVELHTYSKKFNQDIESDFTEMEKFSKSIKAPIIIGEFGTTPSYPLPELRAEHASNFVARAAEHGIKCIWWDNGADYGIINRRDFSASDKEMINALLEGSKGIGYQLEQEIVLNRPEQFVYLTPNIKTGELKYTHWGTLTTDLKGSGIKVQEGTTCTVSLKAINKASGLWIQRLLFFDSKGVLIGTGKEIQAKYYICTIPENAVTMRVSFNNPNVNVSLEDFNQYLMNGDIEAGICFFDSDDLKRVKLPISQSK